MQQLVHGYDDGHDDWVGEDGDSAIAEAKMAPGIDVDVRRRGVDLAY